MLAVRGLRVTYAGGVQALRGLDLDVAPGEALAVVGESGCGKSTLATALLRLLPETATVTGRVRLAGVDVYGGCDLDTTPAGKGSKGSKGSKGRQASAEREVKRVRGALAGLVVQDPMSSFNPVLRVGEHVVEARRLHDRRRSGRDLWPWAVGLLEGLRIPQPERRAKQYPHEWSGGMLQRGAIAAASANSPRLLLADEPTASLDASLAVDVVLGLRERQQAQGAALVLITHQLGLAAQVADRVAVMYAGRLVEIGPARQVLGDPRHPYTRALLAALPRPGGGLPEPLEGEPPPLAPPPPGCAFSARCPLALPQCATGPAPELVDGVACPVTVGAPGTAKGAP